MGTDLSTPVKGSVIAHLASDTDLTAVVPANDIFAMQVPKEPNWPFIRYGSPIIAPYEASCWEGSSITVTIHAFAETTEVEAGEDLVGRIAGLIVDAMKSWSPQNFGLIENDWITTSVVRDEPEADRWHAIIQFRVTAVVDSELV